MNTFGTKFRLTTYGESHGPAVGGIIDGCPAGVHLDIEAIKHELARRRTGAPRQEEDEIEWLSGLKYPSVSHAADNSPQTGEQPITLGTPIAFCIRNKNTRPEDYAVLEDCYRPGHADYTYQMKYGIRDHRGGGRASARETVARVVAGAIAKQVIAPVSIHAEVNEELRMKHPEGELSTLKKKDIVAKNEESSVYDTYGGIVSCRITGMPAGIGDPVFGKLNARLAQAVMTIPSAIGFEMGAGFAAAQMSGSEFVDRWNGDGSTRTNHCGGVQGGISNGMPVEFRVAFHPVATLPQPVECLTEGGELRTVTVTGRHDRCQVMRAPVIVEAMAALTLADLMV